MALSDKVKTALGETRMLILGAQILLGFQLRGAFSEAFPELPIFARILDAAGLGLLVWVVALLILPGPYHRIVARGDDTADLLRLITTVADAVLLPFALALGVGVFVSGERIWGAAGAAVAGAATAAAAVVGWYGLPWLARCRRGGREGGMGKGDEEHRETPLDARIEQLLVEARVVLPGAQALFGFQLAIVLTNAFGTLPAVSRLTHAVCLCLVALSVILLMAPAAYHRIVFAGENTEEMHRVGSVMVTAATVPLAFGLAGDVYVVIARIAGSTTVGLASGAAALCLLVGLWHVFPVARRSLRNSGRDAG
ncbi:MAG TPA: DUF6328 family protein [Stellaceae bacterium]|nr:DUF6328 family protein [Stellaceae bacterium]